MTYTKGNYYHIYNRGCNKEPIFFKEDHYRFLIKLLEENIQFYHIKMLAYCLMPNHYHFLAKQTTDDSISNMLRYVFNTYTQKINAKMERTGTLFEGRAKHILIDKEEYLAHVMRYVHLNPVKAGFVASPEEWKYSNYLECIGKRKSSMFDEETLKLIFGNYQEYETFVMDYKDSLEIENKFNKYLMD